MCVLCTHTHTHTYTYIYMSPKPCPYSVHENVHVWVPMVSGRWHCFANIDSMLCLMPRCCQSAQISVTTSHSKIWFPACFHSHKAQMLNRCSCRPMHRPWAGSIVLASLCLRRQNSREPSLLDLKQRWRAATSKITMRNSRCLYENLTIRVEDHGVGPNDA